MKLHHLIVFALVLSFTASGAYKVMRRNIKLPSQNPLHAQSLSAPALGTASDILAANAGDTTGVDVTVTTFAAQPSPARVLEVTPGGTTADVAAGNVVITGLNEHGKQITDTIAIAENQSSVSEGTVAFASVSSIVLPAEDSPYGATWDVGQTDKLGLRRCMSADNLVWASFGGAYESTRPTVSYDVDEVEKNFALLNSALDGSSDVALHYIENYRCEP